MIRDRSKGKHILQFQASVQLVSIAAYYQKASTSAVPSKWGRNTVKMVVENIFVNFLRSEYQPVLQFKKNLSRSSSLTVLAGIDLRAFASLKPISYFVVLTILTLIHSSPEHLCLFQSIIQKTFMYVII